MQTIMPDTKRPMFNPNLLSNDFNLLSQKYTQGGWESLSTDEQNRYKTLYSKAGKGNIQNGVKTIDQVSQGAPIEITPDTARRGGPNSRYEVWNEQEGRYVPKQGMYESAAKEIMSVPHVRGALGGLGYVGEVLNAPISMGLAANEALMGTYKRGYDYLTGNKTTPIKPDFANTLPSWNRAMSNAQAPYYEGTTPGKPQRFIASTVGVDPHSWAGMGIDMGVPALIGAAPGMISRAGQLASKLPKPNLYKVNPFANRLNKPGNFYRVAGADSYEDFVNTGGVRSVAPTLERSDGSINIGGRPTSFPSFSDKVDLNYAQKGQGNVIYESGLPMYKRGELNPVTNLPIKGRHYAHRAINEDGSFMSNIPKENIKVYDSTPHWLKGFQEKTPQFKNVNTKESLVPAYSPNSTFIERPITTPTTPSFSSQFGANTSSGRHILPPIEPNAQYLTQAEAVQARANRMLAQKDKWVGQDNPKLEGLFQTSLSRHNPASDYPGGSLGVNRRSHGNFTEVSRDANSQGRFLNDANKSRVAAHEVGHNYTNSSKEANDWLGAFDLSKVKDVRDRNYLRGKPMYDSKPTAGISFKGSQVAAGNADEIRERMAQLKDYIAYKKGIPLDKDFRITMSDLDDAINNYVKTTGLDNNMSSLLGAIKDKKELLKLVNKYALTVTGAAVTGAVAN